MNQIFCIVFSFLIFCFPGKATTADEQAPHTTADEQTSSSEGPFFWEVSKKINKGIVKTAYFFGSLHHGVVLEDLDCSDEIRNHLEASDLVFSETEHIIQLYDIERKMRGEILHGELAGVNFDYIFSADNSDFQKLNPESQAFLKRRGIIPQLTLTGFSFAISSLCYEDSLDEEDHRKNLDSQIKQLAQSFGIPVQALDPREFRFVSTP